MFLQFEVPSYAIQEIILPEMDHDKMQECNKSFCKLTTKATAKIFT